jgi:hypothetical protein
MDQQHVPQSYTTKSERDRDGSGPWALIGVVVLVAAALTGIGVAQARDPERKRTAEVRQRMLGVGWEPIRNTRESLDKMRTTDKEATSAGGG